LCSFYLLLLALDEYAVPKWGANIPPTVVCHAEKRATTQIAHLVFADTQANLEKPKELFFSQRSTEIETELNE